jgi:integrase/recombinase XerD
MLLRPTSDLTHRMADVASTDELLDLWLHGKSRQSQRAYRTDVAHFLAFCDGKPLQRVTLNDVQAFSTALEKQGYSSATQNRRLSAVKSLLAFGHKIGYLPFDVGAPVEAPPVKNTLAERILSELEVMTMIALETNHRNKLLIRFLYLSGARVSEAAELRWRDLKSAGSRGQVTLFGKGGKTRILALPADLFKQLMAFRGDAPADAPVFASRQGGGSLKPNQIRNIIARAGKRAGIEGNVSPHWLRHSHASHSLDRGAPIQLVQSTLGHASVATTSKYLHAKPSDSSSLYLPG